MLAITKVLRGKFIFFIIDWLEINKLDDSLIEFENHCHGNMPVIKKSV